MRRYIMSDALNMRDLGGYPIDAKTCTKYGAFIRSDAPEDLTEDELQFIKKLGVRTVVDLRSPYETGKAPSAFRNIFWIDYHNRFLNDHYENLKLESDIPRSYVDITLETKAMCYIFKVFAAAEGGVLYHCAAGKDRTGVVSAMLLLLAGVCKEDIIADYQVSATYRWPLIKLAKERNPHWPDFIGHSKPEYMETFLRVFLKTHGSAHNYFLEIGLTEDEIARIKAKLV